MRPEIVPLLDHQQQDDQPQKHADPGSCHRHLQTEVVLKRNAFKISDVRQTALLVPKVVVLVEKSVFLVVLFQRIMVFNIG